MEYLFVLLTAAQDVRDLIGRLGSDDVRIRMEAEEALAELGASALEPLRDAAASTDAEIAVRAKSRIARILQNQTRAQRLREAPAKERLELVVELRREATEKLGGHPPQGHSPHPDLIPLFQQSLRDVDKEVRKQASWALAYMNHRKALPALQEAVAHRDSDVNYPAAIGLGWLGRHPEIRTPVVEALKRSLQEKASPSFDQRYVVACSLAELGEIPDDGILLEGLKKGHGQVSLGAKVMANQGRTDAILLIIKRMASVAPVDAADTGKALETLTGESFGGDVVKWYRWFEKNRDRFPAQIEE